MASYTEGIEGILKERHHTLKALKAMHAHGFDTLVDATNEALLVNLKNLMKKPTQETPDKVNARVVAMRQDLLADIQKMIQQASTGKAYIEDATPQLRQAHQEPFLKFEWKPGPPLFHN